MTNGDTMYFSFIKVSYHQSWMSDCT